MEDKISEVTEIIKAIALSDTACNSNISTDINIFPNTLLLNISDKEFLTSTSYLFHHQIAEVTWHTPGIFTHAPSIQSILAVCYIIKGWLDINISNKHATPACLIHCSNGKTRTGIVIACILKYTGAYDSCAEAFQMFCRLRYASVLCYVIKYHYVYGCVLCTYHNYTFLHFYTVTLYISIELGLICIYLQLIIHYLLTLIC